MKCVYINLDRATERRAAIEANFAEYAPRDWKLVRFRAVDVEAAKGRQASGRLPPGGQASFLSHLDIVADIARGREPVLILEDDAVIGPNTASVVDNCIKHMERAHPWDTLYLEAGMTRIGMMADLLMMRRDLLAKGQTRLLDLKNTGFMGSSAYVVHPRGAAKILAAAPRLHALDVPYDLFLRHLVDTGRLTARVIFPFATCISDLAEQSQWQAQDGARTDFIWNLFRRMAWRDGSVEPHLGSIADLSKDLSIESKAYAIIWAAMADPSFRPK